jgi:hypothetical protein
MKCEIGMFNFDPTIKLGDLLTIASFLGLGVAAYYNLKSELKILAIEVMALKKSEEFNSTTLRLVATQKVEIDHIKQDINELKHGEGFVFPLKQRG